MLDFLGLPNHSKNQVFKRCHYSAYINKVIKFNVVQKLMEEASKYVKTPKASENLSTYLEKIKEIEK
jgi:hypothetical protein